MNQEIYDNSDTICAISTPGGVGGIAVIRVSGADAVPVVSKIWKGAKIDLFKSHTAHLAGELHPAGQGHCLAGISEAKFATCRVSIHFIIDYTVQETPKAETPTFQTRKVSKKS